jgi:hypothetical protein
MTRPLIAVIAAGWMGCLCAQQAPPRMEITLERQEGNQWKRVDPGLVFEANDRLRFRFRANFEGRLYVMNFGTSGNYSLLFPREETGRQNRIVGGKEYRVPATEAWFRVAGPPGHDVLYWLMSPVSLGGEELTPPAPPAKSQPPRILTPRCDDALFKARGQCIDSSAGPRNVTSTRDLPDNINGIKGLQSRELIIMRNQESVSISSAGPLRSPVVYEFRLAHR